MRRPAPLLVFDDAPYLVLVRVIGGLHLHSQAESTLRTEAYVLQA